MGQSLLTPVRVFIVGAPGLDNIARLPLLEKEELSSQIGMSLDFELLLVTYHPVTLDDDSQVESVDRLMEALSVFPTAKILITGVNADTHGKQLSNRIKAYVKRSPASMRMIESLGQLRYLSAMRQAAVVIGNSSSGLIEAPATGTPTVNIGARQQGRLRAPSVIDCNDSTQEIVQAIKMALSPAHQKIAKRGITPYGEPGASVKIAKILRSYSLDGILYKRFHDLPAGGELCE